MMSEILNCIKLIKMYAWEKPFAKAITGKCIFVLNTFLSLIMKNKIFSCISTRDDVVSQRLKFDSAFLSSS